MSLPGTEGIAREQISGALERKWSISLVKLHKFLAVQAPAITQKPLSQSPDNNTLEKRHSGLAPVPLVLLAQRSTRCACLSVIHNYFQEPFKNILKTLSIQFHGNNFQ